MAYEITGCGDAYTEADKQNSGRNKQLLPTPVTQQCKQNDRAYGGDNAAERRYVVAAAEERAQDAEPYARRTAAAFDAPYAECVRDQ